MIYCVDKRLREARARGNDFTQLRARAAWLAA